MGLYLLKIIRTFIHFLFFIGKYTEVKDCSFFGSKTSLNNNAQEKIPLKSLSKLESTLRGIDWLK